jgi:membrane associated rhomboid family serine protease
MKFCTPLQYFSNAPVTTILVVIILIFSLTSFFNRNFFYKMVLHPYSIVHDFSYHRIFTADLVHNDIQHFILNEACLVTFCGFLERHLRNVSPYGSLQFITIYTSSLLSGNLFITYLKRNDIKFSSAGASGSILGCLFGYMFVEPDRIALYVPVIGAVRNEFLPIIWIGCMWLLRRRIKKLGVNYEVHFWGAVGGILCTLIITRL